jgi:hypothetical protein
MSIPLTPLSILLPTHKFKSGIIIYKQNNSSNPAKRLHIHANRIRSIGKESHNLEENLYGIEEPEYLEYVNIEEFSVWVLSLKLFCPKIISFIYLINLYILILSPFSFLYMLHMKQQYYQHLTMNHAFFHNYNGIGLSH